MRKQNIAVIGGGVSGLSAAWLLSKGHNVTLFERGNSLGGHAHTVDVETADGTVPVDTGFIVFNKANYPNLCALFRHLDVECATTEMSFSLTHDFGRYEYAGHGSGYFGQRRNIANVQHWMLLKEINRFFRNARRRIALYHTDTTLGEFLEREHYSRDFIDDHIIPMGAAIWSTSMDRMLEFPARAFVDFYANHGMLQFKNRPDWNTVAGGSRTYVNKLVADGRFHTVLGADIKTVARRPDRVLITMRDGVTQLFDHVVMATHADQALALLGDRDAAEAALLSAFPYQENTAFLHCDERWMPKRNRLWSSWNYIKAGRKSADELCVSYWMNRLQSLPTRDNIFVTLNPIREIASETIIREMRYEHPVFTAEAFRAQENMPTLQGYRRTWYCGSYLGYGFHEDGLASGLAVAEKLGGLARPWASDPAFDLRRSGFEEYLQVAE
ncbi:FAD-dependent oxidoreductase [Nitratireductor sp. XY-223]|uniref:NAD(P)/FAD-dependent oxidoreductase n=1 Tax=Nitratireductor sp. XY-223 TaxID=2561926 RepID=UPI001FEFCD7F|nr:FAD-dependent oxidoreductase [Nitratireductor sp. XY-223]